MDCESRSLLSDEEIIDLFFERNENAINETELKYKSYLFAVAKTSCIMPRTAKNA